MKKYIPLIISILLFIATHSCRQGDDTEENQQQNLKLNRTSKEDTSKADSITTEKDPPVKDGQDWKIID